MIERLTPNVIDCIAAGEVIERPASVAKEVLENALDAGATHVDVTISGGGLERICVSDNGCGMLEEDMSLAIERHATSKLKKVDDLFMLTTLGFRGEALSSIAAVSRMTLTSRHASSAYGWRVCIEGGEVLSSTEIGA
ncbi:MAG: DNA mismatch repair endonuclease MutL, partial [Myxococcota bacterium]